LLVAACSVPIRFASPADTSQGTAASPTPSGGAAQAAPSGSPGNLQTAAPNGSGALAALQENIRKIVADVTPSVVQIDTASGLGSGVVVDAQGDIVTNSHVVGNSSSFQVSTADGHTYQGSLVGNDPSNDLAEIRVSVGDASPLKPATFGDSSQVRVGDIVLAIGSPLGLSESVSEGIVSGLGRQQQESASVTLTNLIQTTAPLNPGNSGGALVDISGHVVGIPTLSVGSGRGGSASNIGFAIPSSQVQNVTKQLGNGGQVTHTNQPYIGVTATNGVAGGAEIASVVSGGPADKAGVQAQWVMTSFGGHAIGSAAGLTQVLAQYKPGDRVDAVFQLPDGSKKTVNITVGERP
jgi:S1-C subfamily serine protease